MYTLSKENKNAESGYESAITAVVRIIFEESGAGDVVVNSRILITERLQKEEFGTAKGL